MKTVGGIVYPKHPLAAQSQYEIGQAEELGVEIVKLFPGTAVGGPGFVKALRGPCPWTRCKRPSCACTAPTAPVRCHRNGSAQ